MDLPADRPAHAAADQVRPGPPGLGRRRPSGQPPPLPHHLQTTGVGWLAGLRAPGLLAAARSLAAVVAELTAACDPAGATEAPSRQPGVCRYERAERRPGAFAATWYDRFPGGCVTWRLRSTRDVDGRFAAEAPQVLGFVTRQSLRQAVDGRSGGRLRLTRPGRLVPPEGRRSGAWWGWQASNLRPSGYEPLALTD